MFLNAGNKLKLFGLLVLGITTTVAAQDEILLDQGNFARLLNNSNPDLNGSYFQVVEDITLPLSWTPVGTAASPASLNFNGSYRAISGLNAITEGDNTPTGLFGYLVDSWVHSVILYRPVVHSEGDRSEAGAIAGRILRTNITENLVTGGSVRTHGDVGSPEGQDHYSYAGGIIGSASFSRIENNLNNARVHTTGNYCHAGGVMGYQSSCTTSGNINTGDVSSEGWKANAAGTTGHQEYSRTSNSMNTGDVSSEGDRADAAGTTGFQELRSTTSSNVNTGGVRTEGDEAYAAGTTGAQESMSITSNNVNTGNVRTEGDEAFAAGATGYQRSSSTIGNVNTGDVRTEGDAGNAAYVVGAHAAGTTGTQARSSTTSGNVNTGDVSTIGNNAYAAGATGAQSESTTTGNFNTGGISTMGEFARAGGAVGTQDRSMTSGNINTGDVSTVGASAHAGGAIGSQDDSTTSDNLNSGFVTVNETITTVNTIGFTQVSESKLSMGLNSLNGTLWIAGDNSQFPMLRGVNAAYRDLQRINGTRYGNNSFPIELNRFADPGGSTDDSLFDLAVWNVCDGYLPFPKAIGRARAETVGIDCCEGGFACDCDPEVGCPEPAPDTACLFTFPLSGAIEHLSYDGQRYHGIFKAASGLAYWVAYENGNQAALEPCWVYSFHELSPSGIVVDAAVSDGNNAYVVYHIPELSGQAQTLMLGVFTLSGQQHVSSSVLGLDRVVSLSIDGGQALVNTGQDVCRLPVANTGQLPDCDGDLSGLGEVIQLVAGHSGDLYLLTYEEETGYRIRTVSKAGNRADFMVSIPGGTRQNTITPTLKVIGQHLHLLLVNQDLIIWRQYPLTTLPEMFNDDWESEVTAPMPRNITPAAIALIPETDAGTGLEQEQVFILGHQAGQPQYARLMATDFTASPDSTASSDSTDQHSGTQTNYPSLLLILAAAILLD